MQTLSRSIVAAAVRLLKHSLLLLSDITEQLTHVKLYGVFLPVLPMVCICHSPGTFANNINHKYSIGSSTRGFGGKYHMLIFQFL